MPLVSAATGFAGSLGINTEVACVLQDEKSTRAHISAKNICFMVYDLFLRYYKNTDCQFAVNLLRLRHMRKPFVARRLPKLAKKIGARIFFEPEYSFVGQITFKNGKKTFFKNIIFDINTQGAARIAKDKSYASFFLKKFGYQVPRWIAVFNDAINRNVNRKKDIDTGFAFARTIGFPVIVKPNDKSMGRGVTKVHTKAEFYTAARDILKTTGVMQVQQFCEGNDYRIVVLDNEVISAYQRLPLSVVGDGRSTVAKLLIRKQKEFSRKGRGLVITASDKRIRKNLRYHKLTIDSVLQKGLRLQLLDNANLSTGGDAIDVTQRIHSSFKKLAIRITHDMGLRLCGVDIITQDITKPADHYAIIEINDTPGLDNYSAIGKKQEKIVDELYLKILKALEK